MDTNKDMSGAARRKQSAKKPVPKWVRVTKGAADRAPKDGQAEYGLTRGEIKRKLKK